MAIGYQLKITIRGSKPPIWRRVIVPENIAFCDLDDIVEKLFGWTHSHMYEFYIKDWNMRFTGAPLMEEEDNAEECVDSWMRVGSEIIYTYDFGDSWEHLIQIEKIVDYEYRSPLVLKAKGPNMIEDCGGIWGFYNCIEEATPFDIEAVNKEFSSWMIPIAEPIEELMGMYDEDDEEIDSEWEEDFFEEFIDEDNYVRQIFGDLQSLGEVFIQYSKEELVEIAKAHGFRGYSKYGKQGLIEWLVENLLDVQYFQDYILHADKDEIKVFEDAIEYKGIYLSEEMLNRSLFLSTYGGFLPYYNFYHIPKEVQALYEKCMTDEIRKKREVVQDFYDICYSAIYLYGVLSITDLTAIYNRYMCVNITGEEIQMKVENLISRDNIFVLKNECFMDERLAEDDLYKDVLKEHEKIERYIPDSKEKFLSYGREGIQEPNSDTTFFLEYIMKEANLDYSHAILAFYLVQEAIRMNQDEELFGILMDLGCPMDKKAQCDKAEKMLRKIMNRTRKWDYNGHTWMELNTKVVEFTVERRKSRK